MYSFEQHSIAIDSHENVMEQLSTSLNSVAQPFAALQSFCRALRMSRVHVRKKNYPSQPAQQPRLAYKLGLAQM
jgi:hypothetical protein